MSTFWHNLLRLSWAQRIDYVILILIVLASIQACFFKVVNLPWRIMYIVTALTTSIYLTYAMLLLFGVFTIKDYRVAVGWITSIVLLCLLWPSALHRIENHTIKEKTDD